METSTALSASLPAGGGQLDVRFARSIFGDVHAAAENDLSPFRRMAAKLCEAFLRSSSPNDCESHSSGTRSIFGDVHAAAENGFEFLSPHGGETLRGVPSLILSR